MGRIGHKEVVHADPAVHGWTAIAGDIGYPASRAGEQ